MHIAQVDLENVKSYRRQSITFTAGTNAICGANGAGKSTLLEAVGLALFGHSPFSSRSHFVREGEKVATITVHLVDDDDRVYHVVRKCGSSNQHYVYDPELDQKLTEGVSDTIDWLCDLFGAEEGSSLSALFQDAVGVPQGLLTAAFLLPPGPRKGTFNPLLRVDEYERVWDALLKPRNQIKDSIVEQEKVIAGCEAQVETLPEWAHKSSILEAEIESDERRQGELGAELGSVGQQKTALESVKKRLDELQQEATKADGEVKGLKGRLDDAQAALERARAAHRVVQETQAGHNAYLDAQARLEALEGQRKERDALRETLQERTTELRLAEERGNRLETDLRAIAEAKAEMDDLCPQAEEQQRLERGLEQARLDARRLEDARQSLAQEQDRLADLAHRLAEADAGLQERTRTEKAIEPLSKETDALNRRREALVEQAAGQRAEREQLERQAARLRTYLDDAEQALEQERTRLADLEQELLRVRSGLDERLQVEQLVGELRNELEEVQRRQEQLTTQAATCQAELDLVSAQADVLEATEAAQCPVCGAPLTPEHRAELLAEHLSRLTDLGGTLCETQSRQRKAEETRQDSRETLRGLETRLGELSRPADEAGLVARVEAQHGQVGESGKAVTDTRAELSDIQTRQSSLEAEATALRKQLDAVENEGRETQDALDKLQARLQVLPRPGDVESLAADVSAHRESVAGKTQAVESLSGAPGEVARLEAALTTLGNPRLAYQRAAEIAARAEEAKARLQETQSEIAGLAERIAELREQLVAYADLDPRIEDERTRQAAHASANKRYLEHIREAEALNERTTNVAALTGRLDEAQVERDRLVAERDQVAGQYDADAYTSLLERQGALSDERATLNERLRLQREQLAEARAAVERLEEAQRELAVARAERDELQEVQALLEYLRHVLRDAGPKITQALVEVISLQAARMYADIMADHSARLRWTADFEVLLAASGRERTFKQLSGGEQMAAALAVRLSLLRQASKIAVAFFDEPTANLDEARRDNLAEQIMNIKGFSQLFVISHDDTFERDTDNVVRVVKENGESRVEA